MRRSFGSLRKEAGRHEMDCMRDYMVSGRGLTRRMRRDADVELVNGGRTKPRPVRPDGRNRVFSLKSSTKCCIQCGKPLALVQNSNARYCYDCREARKVKANRERSRRYAREHRAEIAQYQRERYQWLISKGFCVSCGVERAETGYVRCPKCRAKYKGGNAYGKRCRKSDGD